MTTIIHLPANPGSQLGRMDTLIPIEDIFLVGFFTHDECLFVWPSDQDSGKQKIIKKKLGFKNIYLGASLQR